MLLQKQKKMAHMMTQKLWKIIKYFSELPSNKKGAWSKAPFLFNQMFLKLSYFDFIA